MKYRLFDKDLTGITNTELDRFLNQGERDIARRTDYATDYQPVIVSAWEPRIALPSDTLKIHQVFWLKEKTKLNIVSWMDFNTAENLQSEQSGDPYLATHQGEAVYVYPAPSGASATALINDAGNISATATTITYDTASATLRGHGFYKIDSEWIQANSNSTTQLKNCKRGRSGTTAATHNDNATITQADILVVRSYVPAIATASVNTAVPDAWIECIHLYATWKALEADRRGQEAAMARAAYIEQVTKMKMDYEHRYEERDPYLQPFAEWSFSGGDPMGAQGDPLV